MRSLRVLLCLMISYFSIAEKPDILSDIRDHIQDTQAIKNYRGYSNILADISSTPAESSLDPYWTGEALYKDTFDQIQMVQLIHDVLLSFPHKDISDITNNDLRHLIQDTYSYITKRSPDSQTENEALKVINAIKNNDFFLAYEKLYTLNLQSLNCQQYWEGDDDVYAVIPAVAENKQNYSRTVPTKPDYCQKIICTTTSNRPYNGFYTISNKAEKIKTMLQDLNCDDRSITSGRLSNEKIKQCQVIKDLANKQSVIHQAPSRTNIDLSLADGERYIKDLINGSEPLQKALQPLVLLFISEEITAPRYQEASLSNIYQTSTAYPDCQQSNDTPSPGKDNHRCTPLNSQNSRTDIDLFIGEILETQSLPKVIQIGLPLGLYIDPQKIYFLMAGGYHQFQPASRRTSLSISSATPQLWKSLSAEQHRDPNGLAIYINSDSITTSTTLRNEITQRFYTHRALFQKSALTQLLSKSASITLINDIRLQNEKVLGFENRTNLYRSTQLQYLKDSSQRRLLSGDESWLSEIATLSNTSLLKEIAILLAEIKLLQFFQFMNQQKQLLFSAISSSKNQQPSAFFRDQLYIDISKYLSGGAMGKLNPSSPSTLLPPNQAILDDMVARGTS